MNQNLVLGYWDCRGLAESIRLLMEYLDLTYTEDKYADKNDKKKWLEVVKPKMSSPFPNLPYLIDGDKAITESDAIMYYLAHIKGRDDLFGVDFEEKLVLLQIRGVIKDVANEISELTYSPNYTEKLKEQYLAEGGFIQNKLAFLNNFLEGKKFLAGKDVKYVDFWFYETVEYLKRLSPQILEKFERLNEYSLNFRKLNGIENYLKSPRFDVNKSFTNKVHSVSNI